MIKTQKNMLTYTIQINEIEPSKIEKFLDFVRSHDFVKLIENNTLNYQTTVLDKKSSALNGYLETKEIRAIYPDEWVLLENPIMDGAKIVGGTVLFHDIDKRKMALEAREIFKYQKNIMHFYTGETTKNAKIGLLRKIQKV
jgi:hypothetical protein